MIHYDREGTRLGFWLFLFTEFFLFAAMFLIYAVYRGEYIDGFQAASAKLSIPIGTINTCILLFSSWTVVLALKAMKLGNTKHYLIFMFSSVIAGLTFLGIKSFEWMGKFSHGYYLSTRANIEVDKASELLQVGPNMLPEGEVLFFALYFVMTGIHALHIIIGLILFVIGMRKVKNWTDKEKQLGLMENFGLYWHLVDVIWIFLFPLFYLVG